MLVKGRRQAGAICARGSSDLGARRLATGSADDDAAMEPSIMEPSPGEGRPGAQVQVQVQVQMLVLVLVSAGR